LVSHFSLLTQEHRLLQTDILDSYYRLAGLGIPDIERPVDRVLLKDRLRPWRKRKNLALWHIALQYPPQMYSISLRDLSEGDTARATPGR
jgi:hypothetical protein